MKPISNIGAYILAALLFVQAFQAPIVYVAFKVQQDYIADNLCENRFKEITVCRGSCVLKEDLEKVMDFGSDKSAEHPTRIKLESSPYCLLSHFTSNNESISEWINFDYPHYSEKLLSGYSSDLFIPPQLSII
ncbi:hypothetical protein LVD15_20685 [Fulvivirga maritima]|uniref:hypothetical protein n=1 Tax=Fulvivirga maritima TaxID=2904247 RepID=UPI001F35EC12|nr:hypothetical protein [Fulvivirga maritima]UII25699.1 hypothetical protein LVD15_20685 [Fulvivirga maritima]